MSKLLISKFVSKSNVRKVDKRSTDYKALRDNIKVKGVRTPITYFVDDKGDYVIINGHQRLAIAKDLKHDKILACKVNGSTNITEEQISVNMFTVPMTIYDASTAISKMMEKEPDITRKELQLRFGKSAEWVQKAISLTNLMPELKRYMVKHPPESEWYDYILVIAAQPLRKQWEALSEMFGDESMILGDNTDITEFVELYNEEFDFYEELEGKVTSLPWQWNTIKSIIGETKFREYENMEGIEHSYAHSIFSEYAKEQWHSDSMFLVNVFLSETKVGKFLKDVPVDPGMPGWGNHICSLPTDVWNSTSKFYSRMKSASNEPFSNVELVEWDGNVFHPHVKFHIIEKKVKTKDADGNDVETTVSNNYDAFRNSYNKINKWLFPIVESMFFWNKDKTSVIRPVSIVALDPPINIFKKDENGMNIVVKWFVQETDVDPVMTAPWWHDEEDKEYHPLYNFTTKEEKPLDNDMLMQHMGLYWFDKHFLNVTYEEIHKLLHALDAPSIDDVLTFNYAANEDFRVSYLNLMPLKSLQTLIKGTPAKNKKDAVEILSADKKMPFMDKLYTVSGQSSNGCLKEYRPEDTE